MRTGHSFSTLCMLSIFCAAATESVTFSNWKDTALKSL